MAQISEKVKVKLKQIGKLASSRFETVINSYEIALRCIDEKIPGAFVECGVGNGSQIAAMGYAALGRGVRRDLYLYDSFCGIPMAGPKDTCQPGIGAIKHNVNVPERELLKSSGAGAKRTEPVVRSNFNKWGIPLYQTHFVKGWFQDTVPGNKIERIAILRLDGDLYASTKVCLEHLYSKVAPEGFVIIDDYALTGCKRAVHEFMGANFKYQSVPQTSKVIWWRKSEA